ncbi:glycoside hydrolase family 15 protein [Salinibacterium hongtaonis]|uniref:glycoside hydrolase family 15 protein n=1 Tax=Homoserinimonas hongtaonis TaxID=2079791 RepID=UPI000D38998A|nr:glycoside hydrolase family 15 protein [Salinibacterium hongtaonis]AWB89424.1 glucoamylase [Salinibacterium hongtaonis]
MPMRIEDYALIGDRHTAALIGRDGSIDWLCFPRLDSPSMFGALLGSEQHGRWLLAPADPVLETHRRYDGETFILVTRWVISTGEVETTEFMASGDRRADIIRRVRGIRGTVRMKQELRVRFGYASAMPWMRQQPEKRNHALVAVAGPDAVVVRGPKLTAVDHAHAGEFSVAEGETVDLSLIWYPSHRPVPGPVDVDGSLRETRASWTTWAESTEVSGSYSAAVRRSLLVLRALTHEDTGGIAAAATTSLPETWGGVRNWDYRFVWLRDASQTVEVLLSRGFSTEVEPWRGWLLRAIAGAPSDVQIMYGLGGERELAESEVHTLPGYRGAVPVRRGNDAHKQFQGDVFGEVMFALHRARDKGITEGRFSWPLQRALMAFVEEVCHRPDSGIWEIRGPSRHFTHSRVMMWAAFDCAIRGVREHGLDGPVDRWEIARQELVDEIETQGFNAELGSYVQFYGSTEVDASLLQLAQVGYLAHDDPRMLGTVAAIERTLMRDGLLLRYRTEAGIDGLPPGEHPFLACSFWLVEHYALSGRLDEAITLMDRLVGFSNDVGLLSEEYDVEQRCQVGNTPQALSHLALVRAAGAIDTATAMTSA